jgi:hypothetical protein
MKKRMYWNLKDEALLHTLWKTHFGTGSDPVARQPMQEMNYLQ